MWQDIDRNWEPAGINNGAGSGGIFDAGSSFVGDGGSGVIDPYTT